MLLKKTSENYTRIIDDFITMGHPKKINTIYFSYVFICSFLLGSWILTTKYNLFNYPTFYQRAEKEKARGLKLFENYELPLYNETGALKSDTICIKRNVSLAETPLPMTGLVSFPGSGNTWTRHLIQQMTGIGTSSVYCDLQLKKGGFPYECYKKRNRTVVIKTHEPKHITMFTKIVFLIRNPYDAILSYAKFKTGGHTKRPSEEALQQTLDKSFEESLKKYVNLAIKMALKFKGSVHVLQYEKLKTDMANELRELAEFLGANVTKHDIYCMMKLQEGNFHRSTTAEENIQLLQRIFKKDKLLRIHETARIIERLLKDAYDLDVDLKGPEDSLM